MELSKVKYYYEKNCYVEINCIAIFFELGKNIEGKGVMTALF